MVGVDGVYDHKGMEDEQEEWSDGVEEEEEEGSGDP